MGKRCEAERRARRIDHREGGGIQRKERHWRTSTDPFAGVWEEEISSVLERQPRLDATALFEDLQERHPGEYGNGKKRTFQRRGKAWKAPHGADKEGMFRQVQEPGRPGVSGFTALKGLVGRIAGEELDHRQYPFRRASRGWSAGQVGAGGGL